jgi:hypothetical protein
MIDQQTIRRTTAMTTTTSPTRHWGRRLLAAFVVVAALTAIAAAAALADPSEEFGIQPGAFTAGVTDALGNPYTQAGGRPYEANTSFFFNVKHDDFTNREVPVEAVKDVVAELPPGFIGNPRAATPCTQVLLYASPGSGVACPASSQVGVAVIDTDQGIFRQKFTVPVYNVQPEPGQLAVFGFSVSGVVVHVVASLRTDSDYGITTTVTDVSQQLAIYSTSLTFWGVPADPAHDPQRGQLCFGIVCEAGGESAGIATPKPFLSNPTNCQGGLPVTTLRIDSWGKIGVFKPYTATSPVPTGCSDLDFRPTIQARPTTDLADSPSGLEFELKQPQNEDPDGTATAQLKDAVVDLPPGLTVNAASANGLDACSPGQIGLSTPVGQAAAHFNGDPASCPDGSKLGTVEAITPVLDHPLKGSVYLARQNQNPFGSLLAIYLTIEDPQTGLIVKLPGEVRADPASGQLTASFRENPPLPVESLRVDFFEGDAAALKTPATCGTFTTTARLTPWSTPDGADATPSDAFALTKGAGGGACVGSEATAPNKPSFSAGTVDPTAAAFTPFVLKLARPDGSQQIRAIDTTLPKGLLGKLAGIPYCPDASLAAAQGKSGRSEQASASCPSASQVGSVEVGVGAGPRPYYAQGKAYLAGPYKGAPVSLAIVTPAVAGPFDLGNVVVRAALHVDPETAQIHAVSDPIPAILQGIPLDVRSVVLTVDKPSFTLNSTSCAPMSVLGSATSVFGQDASLSSPFQVGECGRLGFKPGLKIDLEGGTKRSEFPALIATLQARSGDANIARTVVALPHSEFLAQEHIKTICTRVQFAAGQTPGEACPAGSIYGHARALTPLLDKPLEGPVYLRSSSHELPDLVATLSGQIDVALVGRIDSVKGGIRTSFESVPDAPVSKFVLSMKGGKKGLLVNSRNLCKSTNKASVQMDSQSGKALDFEPVVSNACKKARSGHHGKSHKKG